MINKKKANLNYIVYNKKINFLYYIEKTFEAGLSLFGWEVKSLRFNKINIENSYIKLNNLNAFLINCNIIPINNFFKKKIKR
ncbi:hypothetical protein SSAmo_1460 [Enterobacterales bacterium endosymbiont of Anomoneura mori]|uniref:SsrA-binding protein n=1 Tax=Enterobacterales bacterium endosymbiont of Anomoneura mori TaxID=3132096 RepID=UPI00399CF86D